ncbi:MAG: hypothetical protein G5Z42_02005 [Caldisphaeraceae archaeon]|nr:hypothetical protein [Caldisphaeraceae archaeon]
MAGFPSIEAIIRSYEFRGLKEFQGLYGLLSPFRLKTISCLRSLVSIGQSIKVFDHALPIALRLGSLSEAWHYPQQL